MGRWRIRQHDPKMVEAVARMFHVDNLVATCLLNRGITPGNVACYLDPGYYEPPDPFLMPDMELAVTRIQEAVAKGEHICIYGDYDADGVTAIAILKQGISELGGNVSYYIPDRFFEGVGLNIQRLETLKASGVSLVITVDTGVRAFDEMLAARAMGLDIIVTDHHTPDPERPVALAVLNPKLKGSRYPFGGLCGAGVAYKLMVALDQRSEKRLNMMRYLSIAAIGTVADMVPLQEENRWIVSRGLKAIGLDETSPLRLLLKRLGIRGDVDALDVSFKVAPRLNAPGRLGDANVAIEFLEGRSNRETTRLINIMEGMNTVRQMLERELELKVENQILQAVRRSLPPLVCVAGKNWHRGILGILACKVLRRTARPVCVFSVDGGIAFGSMRSLPGLNVLEALAKVQDLLLTFGGHPEAAGLSLKAENLGSFQERMCALLAEKVSDLEREPEHTVDAELPWRDLSDALLKKLSQMAPFGIGNALPLFSSTNLILESELLRKGAWYHFEASDGQVIHKCSFYHPVELNDAYERFDSVDLVYSISSFRDEYQVQIIEMRLSKS